MSRKYYFGSNTYPEGTFYLHYSDIEKTLINMVVFKERLSSDVLAEIRKRIDPGVLKGYLRQCPLKTREKVMGIIIE